MTYHRFACDATFEGPHGSHIETELHVEFDHSRADPKVGAPEEIDVCKVRVKIGPHFYDFHGDIKSAALIERCHEHLDLIAERHACAYMDAQDAHAEMMREEA